MGRVDRPGGVAPPPRAGRDAAAARALFWTSILPAAAAAGAAAPQPALELAVVEELLETFMAQRGRMARGLRRSILLSAVALVLVVGSYALEKA